MNATLDTPLAAPAARRAPGHPTHTFRMLLRREYWEHKGGFFWAPIVATAISLVLTIMGILLTEFAVRRKLGERGGVEIDGIRVNNLDFAQLMGRLDAEDVRQVGSGIDLFLLTGSMWPFIVLAFTVFFYCLGSLYDDRKDRSVLFWKSLPVSDQQTVLSKVATALGVAPLLALAASVVCMFALMAVLSLFVLVHGGNPATVLWGPASPVQVIGALLAALPVYVLWAMPTVGWLMLCSAWARSKPFLWAVVVPVFAGIIVTWIGFFLPGGDNSSWFWAHVVSRLLLGTVPGMDLLYRDAPDTSDGLAGLMAELSMQNTLASLSMPEIWIGALAGIAMIVAAIRLRRWRDEG